MKDYSTLSDTELYGCTVRELVDGIFETLEKREAKK